MLEPTPGLLVVSQAGRDEGRYFVVHEVLDKGYVSIVDGSLRKLEKPKRKKIKHLRIVGPIVGELFSLDSASWTNFKVASAIGTLMGEQPVKNQVLEEG